MSMECQLSQICVGFPCTGDFSLGFNKAFEIWLYKSKPLLDASLDVSTSFFYISEDYDYCQTYVRLSHLVIGNDHKGIYKANT